MLTIPNLSDVEIQARVGEQSYRRGRGYFQNQAIFHTRRQGTTIKARCQGTADEPYRVQVTFGEHGISSAECSCPVGHAGFCKHVAALLLTWQARPDDFLDVEELDQALDGRTKPELIALIKQMLLREPDLESLLELPLPNGGKRSAPVDPKVFRRQAAAAFDRADPNVWGIEATIADELSALVDIAAGFAEQNDAASAASVYETIATEVIENVEEFPNDEGDLSGIVEGCLKALADILEQPATDAQSRLVVLEALFAIYQTNVETASDFDLALEVPDTILRVATPDERRVIAGWVRAAMTESGESQEDEQDDDATNEWAAEEDGATYRGFLFDLEADTLGDEEFFKRCRELGRPVQLVERLLDRGRIDEAVTEAERSADHVLVRLAGVFDHFGLGDRAETMLVERSRKSPAPPILDWLRQRSAERGDYAAALALAERIFTLTPSLEGYRMIRELAQRLGRWETTRADLRAILSQPAHRYLLVEAYLDDGDIDRALEAVTSKVAPASASHWADPYDFTASLSLRVAQAAEASRPRAALEIYRDRAERLIELRGRSNYQSACQLLVKVRQLYQQLGEGHAWKTYVDELRAKNRTLRALQEELATAGL